MYSLQTNNSHAAPRMRNSLDAHAANAPTMADTQEQMDADRAIPPFDLTATEPVNVYKYDDLITPAEYEALRCVRVALALHVGAQIGVGYIQASSLPWRKPANCVNVALPCTGNRPR